MSLVRIRSLLLTEGKVPRFGVNSRCDVFSPGSFQSFKIKSPAIKLIALCTSICCYVVFYHNLFTDELWSYFEQRRSKNRLVAPFVGKAFSFKSHIRIVPFTSLRWLTWCIRQTRFLMKGAATYIDGLYIWTSRYFPVHILHIIHSITAPRFSFSVGINYELGHMNVHAISDKR